MLEVYEARYGKYLVGKKLNVGCANNHEPGFINVDKNPDVHPDVVHDLECPPLPFDDNSIDSILGSHIFEHVTNFVPLVEDFHRILKPGGHLLSITPYISSDNAWDNPHHVRGFTEMTWQYFDQRLYQGGPGNAGNGATEGYKGNFQVIEIVMIPTVEFENDEDIQFKKRHWRNVIQEIHAVLRKV